MPTGHYPHKKKTVARDRQHGNPISTGESIVEDLAVVAQPQLEEIERICPQEVTDVERLV